MIIFILVVLVVDLLLTGSMYLDWRKVNRPKNKVSLSDLPTFSKDASCAKCNQSVGDSPIEVNAWVPIGRTDLPVTIKICRRCAEDA